jgi:hypothetical protein
LREAEVYSKVLRGFSLKLLLPVVTPLLLGLTGCLPKKVKAPVIPQAKVPLILEANKEPDPLPVVEKVPSPDLPIPIAEAAATPRPRRRTVVRSPIAQGGAAPSTQAASVESPDESVSIGELTGGDVNPQTRQEAADLIASNDKRLKALSASILKNQRTQVSKIRNFQKQAQDALSSGDAEGAKTLATKAKLLLYELDHIAG